MVRVGVCLSGCGVYDGAEIHESVLTLLSLAKAGADVVCFAPDKEQLHVVHHISCEPVENENRNILQESARIARGDIQPAKELNSKDWDALIFPGGFGAAKNLSDFALRGADCEVDEVISRLIQETHAEGKPCGFICIAPAICAAVFRETSVCPELTIGSDEGTAEALEAMGAKHIICPVNDIHIDETNNILSTPAYMLAENIAQVAEGIEKLVKTLVERASSQTAA
ncbi:MAG: isoprenoid biosynthesis glyoxalase ElbB [Planctomycetota bacterium]|jgi:enhancing lycopene biosynthesis protein 2|nr:isoprenoid biosynthesis glyoxalase ElbB [Planctomycetota bacterium]MDP6942104.1 isoprenoid biosynthesis glyoxalase ElbB [Planctomycetota bacterium]